MTPRVSICVPNLNTRKFLPERFETLLNQSYTDWELLAYDSFSDDGSWEFIESIARRESRMRAWQGPRQGTPGSWNPCIRESRGEYVYIATSDDTMPPDCLEKLVAALDAHPDCDLAHCPLKVIDENGRDVSRPWWSINSMFARSSGPLIERHHVRIAPFDGLLHLTGQSVYISITQLLIRRSLFDRIGYFQSTWGSAGDFNWSMRAGLVANTVHVPETWGGWRVHTSQATAGAKLGSMEHARKIDAMIDDALEHCGGLLNPTVRRNLSSRWADQAKTSRAFDIELSNCPNPLNRRNFILRRLLAGSEPARTYVKSKIPGQRSWDQAFPDRVRSWLENAGMDPVLVPDATTSSRTDKNNSNLDGVGRRST